MNVHIEVSFIANGCGVAQAGTFRLNKNEVNTAFEFVEKIQREYSYSVTLRRVLVNNQKDVTEEVKHLLNAPLPEDSLPF